MWYGGIATADCVGCNLRCVFCGPILSWMKKPTVGEYKSPKEVVKLLSMIAYKRGYRYIRVSGGEPTICMEHLIQVLEEARNLPFLFILETNGILFGVHKEYVEMLSEYPNIHIRVSIKGANENEFERLTQAKKEFFKYQIQALVNLLDVGVSFHPAVVASFSTQDSINELKAKLNKISSELTDALEIEYIVLYPHVIRSLLKHGITPTRAYTTNWRLISGKEFEMLYARYRER